MDIEKFKEKCREEVKIFNLNKEKWNILRQTQGQFGEGYKPNQSVDKKSLCPNCNEYLDEINMDDMELLTCSCGYEYAQYSGTTNKSDMFLDIFKNKKLVKEKTPSEMVHASGSMLGNKCYGIS